ncbi:MAG: hypothetical protein P8Y60_17920, partial [Calditrichota bacterium]
MIRHRCLGSPGMAENGAARKDNVLADYVPSSHLPPIWGLSLHSLCLFLVVYLLFLCAKIQFIKKHAGIRGGKNDQRIPNRTLKKSMASCTIRSSIRF